MELLTNIRLQHLGADRLFKRQVYVKTRAYMLSHISGCLLGEFNEGMRTGSTPEGDNA